MWGLNLDWKRLDSQLAILMIVAACSTIWMFSNNWSRDFIAKYKQSKLATAICQCCRYLWRHVVHIRSPGFQPEGHRQRKFPIFGSIDLTIANSWPREISKGQIHMGSASDSKLGGWSNTEYVGWLGETCRIKPEVVKQSGCGSATDKSLQK